MSPAPAAPILRPTLWRTCRVLANRTRLKMLDLLIREQPLSVSALASQLNIALPVASQSLRALEARGFLISRRVSRRVDYRLNYEGASRLVASVRQAFQLYPMPLETIFKLATAFTHPRRVEVFRALAGSSRSVDQLRSFTRIPGRSLYRHLAKLESRGFVRQQQGLFQIVERTDALGKSLARLALE